MKFTKEQLIEWARERKSQAEDFPGVENAEKDLVLAEIALASLTAEPVAWIVHSRGGDQLTTDANYVANAEGMGGIHSTPVYAAPPAPVSVPDALDQFAEFMAAKSIKSGDYPDGWQCKASNAAYEYAQSCRAAMLQGSQPVSNRDELPVSEIECDICGFKSTDPDGAHYCCEDNSSD